MDFMSVRQSRPLTTTQASTRILGFMSLTTNLNMEITPRFVKYYKSDPGLVHACTPISSPNLRKSVLTDLFLEAASTMFVITLHLRPKIF